MAGLPPGDPQLVSMIVSHLKTQGLFDQFRRECLADVDTKPAYLNLKQRVDNFVSNHLSNHTWSPHLNKNQLRNNIRQLVLQSGMLEQGVDRIVAQVVDPKINHIFRPQVERVVREFLSPGSCSEEPPAPLPSIESKPDSSITEQASTSAPTAAAASDAMSILDTITSLNQEASVRASSEPEKGRKVSDEPMELEENEDMGIIEEGVDQLEEAEEEKTTSELDALEVKTEDMQEQGEVIVKEELIGEVKMEEEEPVDHEQKGEEKATGKTPGKLSEEKQDDDQLKSPFQAKQKAKERMKEEYFLEDSDLEGLSDITVSSVHTSDLSSFEGQSDDEQLLSDSSEEGELPPDDKSEWAERKRSSGDTGEDEKEFKPRRKAYVHKPFLYSRYYSDSDDEITVEERRRSAAKDKEERLLKRQQNRERMEEKRKQKAAQAEEQSHKKQKRGDCAGLEGPRAKEARKERKVLEKKMALNRRRKLDSRKEGDVLSKKKGDTGGESFRKVELKSTTSKTPLPKLIRNLSESASSEEIHRRTSGSISEDSSEPKKLCDKPLTHSFILDLEQGSQEALKQRSGKFDRLSRKEVHIKERKEKERSLSDERAKLKQKQEKKSEHQADETQQKEGVKILSEEKGEKKPKIKSEKKITANTREGKISEGVADGGPKDVKKVKTTSTEAAKAEKDKEKDKMREKDKGKEKEKLKGEKTFTKSDFKPLQRPESAGSSEDRSDMDPGSDSSKKKHSKEVLKRSKSHSEDKQGDKPKSKTDSKEIDKEKTKADQDSQKSNKSNSEPEKDPKRVKPTEKGTTVEKVKAKSKEETKTLSKTDKKVQNSDVKSVAGASTSKPETTKEKKKERNAKEQRKVSEEPSQEKSEVKSGKKKLEKDKIPEKNNESQEEKKEPTEEKLERSDKSSVSSPSLETEETPKKQPLLRDTSADSDPITATATVTTSFSDDTCDALSDITSEASEGDTDSQLCEVPAVPAQADALLTLMDVCTSAEARLPPECFREDVSSERALEDADMKMKEAALTLLSMDPDSTVPSSFIIHNTSDEPVETEAAPQPTPTPAVQEEEHPPVDVATAAETEFTTTEASPSPPPRTAELVEGNPNTAENSERKMESEVKISEKLAPQKCQDSLEDEAKKAEILPEAQLKDEPSPPAVDEEAAVFKPENVKGNTEENTGYSVCTTEKVSETSVVSSNDEQMEPDVTDTEMNPKTEDMAEENLANADSEAESTKVEEEHVSEMCEPQSMEASVPDKNEEASEGGPDMQSKLMKPVRSVSSVDSQDDEKGSELSEKEEKTEGRGRRKRKLSSQEVAAVTEFSDERDEEDNEQPSAEETEQTQVVEVNSACRGQSPRTTDETEKDQLDQLEEPFSQNGRRPGAAAKEAVADNQNEDENKQEGSSSGEPAENKEGIQEEITTKTSEEQGSQIRLPTPAQEDTEAAGSSESENIADTPQPAVKRRRSEEMEESVEETHVDKEVKEADSQEQSEQPPQTDICGLSSGSPSKEQEDVKEENSVENKLDDGIKTEEEQQQEDQEATPKRNVRRGRPPKAAAAAKEDSDKKDKKVERKESEQNDDEEEEDGEEGKDAATRATTRLASRLEAERNKPSKPSTRASRQSGKDETAAGTRGTRGQAAAAKGGRKREASPPAVRTRGGQKSEEPPSKRGKR